MRTRVGAYTSWFRMATLADRLSRCSTFRSDDSTRRCLNGSDAACRATLATYQGRICTIRRALACTRPFPRARVVCQAERLQHSSESDSYPTLEITIAEVEAHLVAQQRVPKVSRILNQEQDRSAEMSSVSSSAEASEEQLEAKAAALGLDPQHFRSKLKELLLLMPGVTQPQLLSLWNNALRSLISDTSSVATRLVQLRARWTNGAAGTPTDSQQQQQLQQQQQQEQSCDTLDFIWQRPDLLVGSDWDSFLNTTPVAILCGHSMQVSSVAITPNGRQAVSGSWDSTLRVWDLHTYTCIATLKGHTEWVTAVAITPDGCHAVSGGRDGQLRIWDLQTRTCIATLEGHTKCVTSVAITPDGRRAVSSSEDSTLRVWDLQTYACTATVEGHLLNVVSVAITPDGLHAVTACWQGRPLVWDLQASSLAAVGVAESWAPGALVSVAITPDGRHAVTGSYSNSLHVWELQAGSGPLSCTCTAQLQGHTSGVWCVAVTHDGCYAVSGSRDNRLCVWDLRPHTGRPSQLQQQVTGAPPSSQPQLVRAKSPGTLQAPALAGSWFGALGQWMRRQLLRRC